MFNFKKLFEDVINQHQFNMSKIAIEKYNISKNDIETAKKGLVKKRKINIKYLKYAYINEMMDNHVFISFHIMDPNSEYYKSTINYRWLPIEKRGK